MDLRSEVESARGSSSACAEFMIKLIDTYSLRDASDETRGLLLGKLPEVLQDLQLSKFIDGKNESSEAGAHRLTLQSAQALAEKFERDEVLSPPDLEVMAVLLERAPIQFGYWGPMKSLLKRVDPNLAPQSFGTALGRLSRANPGGERNPSGDCENLSELAGLFSLPSRSTLNYMRRRMRRKLSALGESDPYAYVQVAAAALLASDSDVSSTDFISGYVMFGAASYLTDNSRRVQTSVSQDNARYPHAAAWRTNPNAARKVFDGIQNSPEIFTFAAQVLQSAGEALPALNQRTVPLALASTDHTIGAVGLSSVATAPGCWDGLSADTWMSIFKNGYEADLLYICSALLQRERITAVHSAAWQLLDGPPTTSLGDEESTAVWGALAQVYVAYTRPNEYDFRQWPTSPNADQWAVWALADNYTFELNPELWRRTLDGLVWAGLGAALVHLYADESVECPQGNLDLIEDVAASKMDDAARVGTAELLLERDISRACDDLAWRLMDRATSPDEAATHLWSWLVECDMAAERRSELIGEFLSRINADLARALIPDLIGNSVLSLAPDQLVRILSSSTEAAAILWRALSDSASEEVLTLVSSHRDLLVIVGDQVAGEEAPRFTADQQELLTAYLRTGTDRIARDVEFGVALACLPSPDLQRIALAELESVGAVPRVWMRLAESGLPLALAAARRYLESITDRRLATQSVLAAIDSSVPTVRDLGLGLLDSRRAYLDATEIWAALVESDDPLVQSRVAEESLMDSWPSTVDLDSFDRRVLVTRRVNRGAKERIKTRLESFERGDLAALIRPARISALTELANSLTDRDSEWALHRLALLSLAGVEMEEIQVAITTTGGTDG